MAYKVFLGSRLLGTEVNRQHALSLARAWQRLRPHATIRIVRGDTELDDL